MNTKVNKVELVEVRCPVCHRKLLEARGVASIKCPKCKSLVAINTEKNLVIAKKPMMN